MRSSRSVSRLVLPLLVMSAVPAAVLHGGCSATNQTTGQPSTGGSGGAGTGGTGAGGAAGGSGGEAGSTTGGTGGLFDFDAGDDAAPDVFVNPCGTGCGPVELCDGVNLGIDDDCDGIVDEDCPCAAGQAHACFKGDPSYRNTSGCFDGTMSCTENGGWGPCIGGVHATDNCFAMDPLGCHPITSVPFGDVDLKDGTGNFSQGAVTESWDVTCPSGVNPCPAVGGANPTDDFKPLQSGEYTVTYTKTDAAGQTQSCTYPLFVGAPGLRVELDWEHDLGGTGVDLDLYVHEPSDTSPWNIGGDQHSCGYSNCKVSSFDFGGADVPDWFNGVMPPDPVDWYEDPTFEKNSCYFAPRGVGDDWQALGQGCHNPRLDLDNITCDPSSSDVNDFDYCAPENINIDYPPLANWTRVGVHYYSSHSLAYDVHPRLRIFCDGMLAAELGAKIDPMTGDVVGSGFYDPELPITFEPSDGDNGSTNNRFWLAADVAFVQDMCSATPCVVKPLYANPMTRTPILSTGSGVEQTFGPGYPPAP
jgi:hypothetical protein